MFLPWRELSMRRVFSTTANLALRDSLCPMSGTSAYFGVLQTQNGHVRRLECVSDANLTAADMWRTVPGCPRRWAEITPVVAAMAGSTKSGRLLLAALQLCQNESGRDAACCKQGQRDDVGALARS